MKSLQGLLSAFGKLCLNLFCRDQITCVRRIQARLNLAPKPLGMVRGILLGAVAKLCFSSSSTRKVKVASVMVLTRCVTRRVQCSTTAFLWIQPVRLNAYKGKDIPLADLGFWADGVRTGPDAQQSTRSIRHRPPAV
jgi:hypothetical protein